MALVIKVEQWEGRLLHKVLAVQWFGDSSVISVSEAIIETLCYRNLFLPIRHVTSNLAFGDRGHWYRNIASGVKQAEKTQVPLGPIGCL